jgi:hypothetical protein
MPNKSQTNKTINEPEIVNSGVNSSPATAPGEATASPSELARALETSLNTIKRLELELEQARSNQGSNDAIAQLANILTKAVTPVTAPVNPENINRTTDFRQQQATVDGRSMMETQQALQMFKNEKVKPISIPKVLANNIGSSLAISVNGVRVCIPCDGATHYINETHWEHAKERLAKLDIIASDTEPQIVEING